MESETLHRLEFTLTAAEWKALDFALCHEIELQGLSRDDPEAEGRRRALDHIREEIGMAPFS